MKRTFVLIIPVLCLFGCSKPNYKRVAIEYLKTKVVNPASVDTIKFLKPDTIYTSYYATKQYFHLAFQRDSLIAENNMKEAARLSAVLDNKIKTSPKNIAGWDVKLIYKAKNKAGIIKTDTCRFTFNSNLNTVKAINGVGL
jgi:cytochrome c-type biogenesis protein CcmH/NrfG